MNAIQIPSAPPPQLAGMSGAQLRSAFGCTVLAQLPSEYRVSLSQDGTYES
jgi:hypothetical protein